MTVHDVPPSARPPVRRLARRLAAGLFLDVWPRWAAGALLAAGSAALACRVFVPAASPYLPWLWLAPLVAVLPAALVCVRRAYRPSEVLALADSLAGGQGVLLALAERHDDAWAQTAILRRASQVVLPRLRPWRRLSIVLPAVAFLAGALLLPQRTRAAGSPALAEDIAAELTASLEALKEQQLLTPEDEDRLQDEIERVRRAAEGRVDASTWEAADAVREQIAASAAATRDAAAWAQEALERYVAAAEAGALTPGSALADATATELADALRALGESGLLANAPAELQAMAAGGALPQDPDALRGLAEALAEYLADARTRLGELAVLEPGDGRFDPEEFARAVTSEDGSVGRGTEGNSDQPGAGAPTRGRADAALTWGDESLPADRFKAEALPPGHVRSPDDWAPIVELPGVPQTAPERGTAAAARTYADETGSAAVRRTLAPRHQSAVKKYFQP